MGTPTTKGTRCGFTHGGECTDVGKPYTYIVREKKWGIYTHTQTRTYDWSTCIYVYVYVYIFMCVRVTYICIDISIYRYTCNNNNNNNNKIHIPQGGWCNATRLTGRRSKKGPRRPPRSSPARCAPGHRAYPRGVPGASPRGRGH